MRCFSNRETRRNIVSYHPVEPRKFHPAFGPDVFGDLSMIACVEKRDIPGAPAPARVQQAIDSAREKLRY